MVSTAMRIAPSMRRQENEMLTLAEQLTALCSERGVLKKHIAHQMKIDPAYLAQLASRPITQERVEEIVDAINAIDQSGLPPVAPEYFDYYVWLTAQDRIARSRTMIQILRDVFYRMSDPEREMWERTSLAITATRK